MKFSKIKDLRDGEFGRLTGIKRKTLEKFNLQTGQPNTAHTTNPVPFVFVCSELFKDENEVTWPDKPKFGIASISPTILNFLGIPIPSEMIKDVIKI